MHQHSVVCMLLPLDPPSISSCLQITELLNHKGCPSNPSLLAVQSKKGASQCPMGNVFTRVGHKCLINVNFRCGFRAFSD